MSVQKILLFGATGMLGRAVRKHFLALNDRVCLISLGSADCDITSASAVGQCIATHRPDIVVNCAAYTAVDKAESEPEKADLLNNVAVANIALATRSVGALLIHISTDYVFDGTANSPIAEDSPVNPLSVYGQTKLRGEEAIRHSGCRHIILRVQWLYSNAGKNFYITMLRLFFSKKQIGVVADQFGTPTWVENLARVITTIATSDTTGREGTYHFSDDGQCSWHEFATHIATVSGAACVVNAIPTSSYPTPAVRPAYSVLSKEKIYRTFPQLPPAVRWQDALVSCYANFLRAVEQARQDTI